MNEMMNFNFENKQVRMFFNKDNDPLWVAKDVCEILELKQPESAYRRVHDEDKITQSVMLNVYDTQKRMVMLVNESGVFSLIFQSETDASKRFKRFITKEVLPSIRKTGSFSLNTKPIDQIDKAQITFDALKKVSESFGLVGNQALLCANKATKTITGYDFQSILQIELKNEKQERWLTPTELGQQLSLSPQKINKLLESKGLQIKKNNYWTATDAGKSYSTLLDANKKHSNGTPINQLKWSESVLDLIK